MISFVLDYIKQLCFFATSSGLTVRATAMALAPFGPSPWCLRQMVVSFAWRLRRK